MKKIMTVLIMVLGLSTLFGCATTSAFNDKATIKESKLTSVSYLKKVCNMELIQNEKAQTMYVLDNGKGTFVCKKGLTKSCILVKDEELYGRTELYLPHHVTVFVNLHDDIGTQVSFKEGGMLYYLTEDALSEISQDLKDGMLKLAKDCGLTE